MIGFIGGGKMAEALIKGLVTKGMRNIFVSELLNDRRRYLQVSYGIKTTDSNVEVATNCQTIILAVKPQDMAQVLDEIRAAITEDKTMISIAAGITLDFLQKKLKTKKIARVMPNTPVLVQEGMSAISFCASFPPQDAMAVRELFMSVGQVLTLPESTMNAISALSGSGPAFITLFLEMLIAAGVEMGLTNEQASQAVIQTIIGTAMLLKTGMSPEKLRIMVTSPGGMTAAGLNAFEENGLKKIVVTALHAALKRGHELGC